jgi:putative component of membrane protein insertase Oxa1/YidC/SpoIIIJ protein YidD
MIAKLLILVAKGWQKGPSVVLPPSCRFQPELLGLCNHRASALWGAARRLAGRQAPVSMPPLGGTWL